MNLRLDRPSETLAELNRIPRGARVCFSVRVLKSAQDSADVAASLCDAILICDAISGGLEANTSLAYETAPDDKNVEIVQLCGTLDDVQPIQRFVDDWSESLDADGDGEPFAATAEWQDLFDRLANGELPSEFRWPELVKWFRLAYSG